MFHSHDLRAVWAVTLAEVVLCCHLCTRQHPHDAFNEIKAVLQETILVTSHLIQQRSSRDCTHTGAEQQPDSERHTWPHGHRGERGRGGRGRHGRRVEAKRCHFASIRCPRLLPLGQGRGSTEAVGACQEDLGPALDGPSRKEIRPCLT